MSTAASNHGARDVDGLPQTHRLELKIKQLQSQIQQVEHRSSTALQESSTWSNPILSPSDATVVLRRAKGGDAVGCYPFRPRSDGSGLIDFLDMTDLRVEGVVNEVSKKYLRGELDKCIGLDEVPLHILQLL